MAIKIEVTCPATGNKEILYYSLNQQYHLVSEGCNGAYGSNGSRTCADCQNKHFKEAKERLLEIIRNGSLIDNMP